jgi:adenylate cyclase
VRTRRRRLDLLGEYLTSLGIAFCIALTMIPALLRNVPVSVLFVVPGSTFLYGTAFFLLGVIRSRIRIGSFILNIIVQTILMGATVFICYLAIVWFFASVGNHVRAFSPDVWSAVLSFVFSQRSIAMEVGGLIIAGIINFSFEIGKKLGPGVLTSWITGKYYTPREEILVFMFVDMKDSTMLAEQLGAIKFSALVRDFFRDMTIPLLESKGRVSHYIGDEAVIYWKPADAFKPKGCIAFFKTYEEMIQDRAAYYQMTYGLVPDFKAGMHIGPVVATEVGEVKSEIVFHGDVLNTTARIQSMCNEKGAKFLSSRLLASKLSLPQGAVMSALGPVHLKGKAEEMELVAIE